MVEAVERSFGYSYQLQSCGDSSEEELTVLPRLTKVVTGNNRTKSVLVGLHGVVKKAVGLGGWHYQENIKAVSMPCYDDRHGTTRLYVGHLSRDLEDVFSRYGRNFTRDADDARYSLNGRDDDGSRIVVEFAKGAPRGPGGSREFLGKGPAPGSGRCFNCGLDGHWARDCKAGDWKNKCYRCGDRGHIEKNC